MRKLNMLPLNLLHVQSETLDIQYKIPSWTIYWKQMTIVSMRINTCNLQAYIIEIFINESENQHSAQESKIKSMSTIIS